MVIASRNRSDLLARCLRALGAQSQHPDTFEVIVADDGSTDATSAMLAAAQTPFALRALHPGRVGRAAARNAAVQASRAAICVILDDDVIAAPQLVAEHLAAHRRCNTLLGIGKVTQAPPKAGDWYAHAFGRAWNRHYDGLLESTPDWTAAYGANVSVPRAALIAIGGFATSQLEPGQDLDDIELAFRLWRHGCVPKYLPRAHAVHVDQKPRPRLLDEARLQGEAHVKLAGRVPAMMPKLLGWFGATSRREVALRRAMLLLRVPPGALARAGPLLPGQRRQEIWFDFVSRLGFWAGVRRSVSREVWVRLTRGVPVLLYHAFALSESRDRYVMPRRSFARQMRILRVLRYRVIAVEELAQGLREFRLPPRRAVVITIDDGYADNFEVAHPILRRRGFAATIFLVSGRLGSVNDWSACASLRGRPLMSLEQIAQMRDQSVRFGVHTRSHPSLPELPDEQVREEIEGARADLGRRLGAELEVFAYPHGRYDERSIVAVQRGGFVGACSTEPRLVRPDAEPSLIPRIEIRGCDSLPRFLFKLWFGLL